MSDLERFILIALALGGWAFAFRMWLLACRYYEMLEQKHDQ